MSNICPNCGADNDSDVNYCGSCGTKLLDKEKNITEKKDESIVCPNCQTKNISDADFCISCGTNLKKVKQSKVCPKCQKMNLKDAEFCENCGYDFNKKDEVKGFTKVCPNCNTVIDESVNVCGNCGYDFYAALHQIGYTGPVAQTQNKSKSSNSQNKIVHKNSDLAVKGKDLKSITIYSLIIMGLGHYYNGLQNKAVLTALIGYALFFLTAVNGAIWLILIIFYFLQVFDARRNFEEIASGKEPTILGFDDFLDNNEN